jgi:glycosyltransferase involved in cell wall biosynthesis
MQQMKISVITPVFNGANGLQRTLKSIVCQSSNIDIEHIIQDGGSTDNTASIVNKYKSQYNIKYITDSDNGIYDAVAKGMERASGEILAWLGAGDFYLPWTTTVVAYIFDKYPNVNWITGIPATATDDGCLVKVATLAPVCPRHMIRMGLYRDSQLGFLQQESMFWRRSLWEEVGGGKLIRRYRYGGDYHLWKAFANISELQTVASVLAAFCVSPDQTSSRLRGAYLAETGATPLSMGPAWWGRHLNQILSISLNSRVIRP